MFFLHFFIYLFKRIEATPEGGVNQANVQFLQLLRREKDAAIRRRQGDLCCSVKQYLSLRSAVDSRKCLEDGCKHLVCTRSASQVKNISPSAESRQIPRTRWRFSNETSGQQCYLSTCISFLPLIHVWFPFNSKAHRKRLLPFDYCIEPDQKHPRLR